MSRQLEQFEEEKAAKRKEAILMSVEGGLEHAVGRSGAEFTGLTAKITPVDCLLVVKGILAGKSQVAFVGSDSLGSALVKAVRLAYADKLVWRVDRYGGDS